MNSVAKLWTRIIGIGQYEGLPLEHAKRIRLTNLASALTGLLTFGYFILFLAIAASVPATIMLLAFANYVLVLVLNHQGRHKSAVPLLLVNGNLQIASVALILGPESGVHIFLVAAGMSPFLYYSLEKRKFAVFFACFSLGLYVALEFAFANIESIIVLTEIAAYYVRVITFVANLAMVVLFTDYIFLENQRVEAVLEQDRHRSEQLLINVLPKEVGERIRKGDKRIADEYSNVTILFADIVDDSTESSLLKNGELKEWLDLAFNYFDTMIEMLGLERIATNSGQYFVLGGMPVVRSDHARAVATLALLMRKYMDGFNPPADSQPRIRIGINSGPVTTGVIDYQRFEYDLWGDAIKLARHLEAQGVSGKIHISESAHRLLADSFICKPRGTVHINGVGEINTWFLEEELIQIL